MTNKEIYIEYAKQLKNENGVSATDAQIKYIIDSVDIDIDTKVLSKTEIGNIVYSTFVRTFGQLNYSNVVNEKHTKKKLFSAFIINLGIMLTLSFIALLFGIQTYFNQMIMDKAIMKGDAPFQQNGFLFNVIDLISGKSLQAHQIFDIIGFSILSIILLVLGIMYLLKVVDVNPQVRIKNLLILGAIFTIFTPLVGIVSFISGVVYIGCAVISVISIVKILEDMNINKSKKEKMR